MADVAIEAALVISARLERQVFPPYDALHGTPHAMLSKRVTIETPRGKATFEQTDYGHPGRLNPWQPRDVPASLTGQFERLEAVAAAMGALAG